MTVKAKMPILDGIARLCHRRIVKPQCEALRRQKTLDSRMVRKPSITTLWKRGASPWIEAAGQVPEPPTKPALAGTQHQQETSRDAGRGPNSMAGAS